MAKKVKQPIKKKYQVFVSSTYLDLKEERQKVMYALLELDCIPSGMELFPAANTTQWNLIKGVIDECDYYIVIVGGRYGSIGPENKSYTQMEYEYAALTQKPVIAFLHPSPGTLAAAKAETVAAQEHLSEFRKLVELRMYRPWTSADHLASGVVQSLTRLMKDTPAAGWIRGNTAGIYHDELEELKKQLRKELIFDRTSLLKIVQSVADEEISNIDDFMEAVEKKYDAVEKDRGDNQIVNVTYWWLLIHGVFRFKGLSPWYDDNATNWKKSVRYSRLTERGKMLLQDLRR